MDVWGLLALPRDGYMPVGDFASSPWGNRLRNLFICIKESCIVLYGNVELISCCVKAENMYNGDYEC